MKLSSLVVGPFEENSYLLVDERSGAAVLVDPGDEADRLIAAVRASGATPEAIWLTHAHIDHIGAIAGIRRVWDLPIHLHPADQVVYDSSPRVAAMYGLPFELGPPPDHPLADGGRVSLGAWEFDVLHTPGHAPGHVVFFGHGILLGGDMLFAGSVGRTDLPLSDGAAMQRSLERLAALPPETVVYPGHGPATTIGDEIASNPFLRGVARPVRR